MRQFYQLITLVSPSVVETNFYCLRLAINKPRSTFLYLHQLLYLFQSLESIKSILQTYFRNEFIIIEIFNLLSISMLSKLSSSFVPSEIINYIRILDYQNHLASSPFPKKGPIVPHFLPIFNPLLQDSDNFPLNSRQCLDSTGRFLAFLTIFRRTTG